MEKAQKQFPCKQCSEVLTTGAARFYHAKKVHGIKEAPSMADLGMKETAVVVSQPKGGKGQEEEDIQIPRQIQEIIDHIFAGWLDKLVIKHKWDRSASCSRLDIYVPREMSTEWKQSTKYTFDSDDRAKIIGSEKIDIPDVRSHLLGGFTADDIKGWLVKVKNHILENGHKHGLSLPAAHASYTSTPQRQGPPNTFYSREEYPLVA